MLYTSYIGRSFSCAHIPGIILIPLVDRLPDDVIQVWYANYLCACGVASVVGSSSYVLGDLAMTIL